MSLKPQSDYQVTWVTKDLAVGHAPMSYIDLEHIKKQGIDAIVNLCGEFCDLHEIEEKTGFEVYYFPIPDESAPDMEEMETALSWLDEAIYLGKRVLVHCRFGIGRTGTFVTSYLIRKGLALKVATNKLKQTRAVPSNYSQWRLLKKYSKKSGVLKIREPSLESKHVVDLTPYFSEYEALVKQIDTDIDAYVSDHGAVPICGDTSDACCRELVELQLVEVIYLNNRLNRTLTSRVRTEVIRDAVITAKQIRTLEDRIASANGHTDPEKHALVDAYAHEKIRCPLNRDGRCTVHHHRPIQCRLFHIPEKAVNRHNIRSSLFQLSQHVFFALSGFFLENHTMTFSLPEAVSGKFVQEYFYYLADMTNDRNH